MIETNMFKPIIKNIAQGDNNRLVNKFTINNKTLGELTVDNRIHDDGYNKLIAEIKNSNGEELGHEIYSIEDYNKSMFGYFITIKQDYRNSPSKNFRFGEILRLSSIISMIENQLKNFGIHSKDSAIYFHSKYKFIPNITEFYQRDMTLKTIANDKNKNFEDFSKQAAEYLKILFQKLSGEEKRNMCKKTSLLAKEYIEQVLKNGEEKYHPFDIGIDMVLPYDTLLKNKEFFNSLFQKHGIDYNI